MSGPDRAPAESSRDNGYTGEDRKDCGDAGSDVSAGVDLVGEWWRCEKDVVSGLGEVDAGSKRSGRAVLWVQEEVVLARLSTP